MTERLNIHPRDEAFRSLVRELSEIQCSVSRIASIVGISTAILTKWLKTEPLLAAAREEGLAEGQKRLQKAQLDCAIEDRNPQMLIWLGKQYLGQKEPDKNVKLTADGQTVAQAQAWIEMAKSAAQIEMAKEGGVPRNDSEEVIGNA